MSRGGIRSQTVENTAVGLGGNEFETGAITVAANATVKAGAILKREMNGDFGLADSSDTFVAINPFDIENKGTAAAKMSMRAIVFGRVRADLLNFNGASVGTALYDKIRQNTLCIPVQGNDISRTS
jgi:hypothetical protein